MFYANPFFIPLNFQQALAPGKVEMQKEKENCVKLMQQMRVSFSRCVGNRERDANKIKLKGTNH